MEHGEELKARSDPKVEILVRRVLSLLSLYMLTWKGEPKVDKEEAHGVDDVQRLYTVLRAESGEKTVEEKQSSNSGKKGASRSSNKGVDEGGHGSEVVNIDKQPLLRFIVMGRKSLPDLSKRRQPYWGFVEMDTTKIEDVKTALKGAEYDTVTRGHRHKPPARALAEGVYWILRHNSGRKVHTHLIYKLEFPPEDIENRPQEAFNIEREGSFIIQIKNPDQRTTSSSFSSLQSKRKAVFPAHLQGQFGQRRYSLADPPDFLNYEGCEFLLISASDDIDEELGLDIKTEECSNTACSDLIQMFGMTVPTAPLLRGTWV